MSNKDISQQQIEAFIDGQLDASEKSEILAAIKADPQLGRSVCELRTLSELVQHAYENPPAARQQPDRKKLTSRRWGVAASGLLLLGLGTILGWASHSTLEQPSSDGIHAMYWDNEHAFQNSDITAVTAADSSKKIIVHLNTSSPERFEEALNTAEKLLTTYADSDRGAEIEVVANASAIKMLRAGYSPYAEKVRQLQQRYINLTFLACKDAIDHIQELEGPNSKVQLLPDVDVTPSALEHILERLKEGWVYINV